ncbi:hypothetical protein PRIPAC_75049 [Pristionchus pacificus]|uniref:Uncharacterized protein n=1 Tax=Pristionchus pacificus TaxID=54126 RepID=A0A2A6C6F3_PRIPA|nr:hypothetical protein PRIPAC_75049 [Pristionchus pacificus]|eukprot:PDM73755.1 hypothetical protein PRIPAC_41111 [Pristionchus pacificus]
MSESEDGLNLANLPSDIIQEIIKARLVSPRWNALANKMLSNTNGHLYIRYAYHNRCKMMADKYDDAILYP